MMAVGTFVQPRSGNSENSALCLPLSDCKLWPFAVGPAPCRYAGEARDSSSPLSPAEAYLLIDCWASTHLGRHWGRDG